MKSTSKTKSNELLNLMSCILLLQTQLKYDDDTIICYVPSAAAFTDQSASTDILYETSKDFKMVPCPFFQYNTQIV